MPRNHIAVDRVERRIAVLLTDDGTQYDVPVTLLPLKRVREGDVLAVEFSSDGTPQWKTAVRDAAEGRRRMAEAERILKELKATDPGGDMVL